MVIWVVARDQEVDIKAQLKLGVRMLQAQAHMYALALIFMLASLKEVIQAGTTRSCISATPVSFLIPTVISVSDCPWLFPTACVSHSYSWNCIQHSHFPCLGSVRRRISGKVPADSQKLPRQKPQRSPHSDTHESREALHP